MQVIAMLERYKPTPEEEKFKESMLWFIEYYPNCFERSLTVGHVTASCWLLNKKKSHALLTHHKKLNQWFQLGGHCDGESDVLYVALKEAQEESGIKSIVPLSRELFDIDVHLIPATNKEKAHYHYDFRFLLGVTTDEEYKISDESHALAWVDKNPTTFPTTNRSVKRLFDKWVALK